METTQKSRVSVVIPAYNAAEFLAEALESVLAQTYQPLEVIVVDDGSEDETPQIASAYSGKVTYIRKEHGGGCGGTRNVGIRAASGEWVGFLDADDVWMPGFLENQIRIAEETNADLIFCDALTLTKGEITGSTRLERCGLKKRLNTVAPNGVLLNPFELLLELGCYFTPSSVIVRKDSLLEIGLFDEGIYSTDDLDLWLRLSLSCRFTAVGEAFVLWRVHARNMSHDTWAAIANEIKTYEKLERYAPAVARGTRWRRLLRKRKAPLLRDQGAGYLKRGELLLARKSWAKGFCASYSPIFAAYWFLSFLPQSWVEALQNWKKQALFVLGYKY